MQTQQIPYFIIDLLQQVSSVYVHGLGRFEAIFHPAVIDMQESRIRPPFIEPGFDSSSKHEEQLLPAYIEYVTGMDQTDAADAINSFVHEVNDVLGNGNEYNVDHFGTFSRSDAGIMHFTPDWDAFNVSFRGLSIIDIKPVVQTINTGSVIEPVINYPVEEEPAIEKQELPVVERQQETSWVAGSNPIEEINPISKPVYIPHTQVANPDTTSKFWWWILASALIMITFLCAYLAWDIITSRKNINHYIAITSDSLSDSSPDMIIIDTLDFIEEELPTQDTIVDTPAVDPVVEPPISEPAEKSCYVVVGAFSNAENVIKMESRLSGMGYNTEQIKGGSLVRVAIRSSCNRSELQKVLNDARSQINPGAWIY